MKRIVLFLWLFLSLIFQNVFATVTEVSVEANTHTAVVTTDQSTGEVMTSAPSEPSTVNATEPTQPTNTEKPMPTDVSIAVSGEQNPLSGITTSTASSGSVIVISSSGTVTSPPEKIPEPSVMVIPIQSGATSSCMLNGKKVDCAELGSQVKSVLQYGLGLIAVFLLIGTLFTVFWILMLMHAFSHPIPNKVVWIVVILLLSPLGSIVYYFVVKRSYGQTGSPGSTLPPAPSGNPFAPQWTPPAPTITITPTSPVAPVAPAPTAPVAPTMPVNQVNPAPQPVATAPVASVTPPAPVAPSVAPVAPAPVTPIAPVMPMAPVVPAPVAPAPAPTPVVSTPVAPIQASAPAPVQAPTPVAPVMQTSPVPAPVAPVAAAPVAPAPVAPAAPAPAQGMDPIFGMAQVQPAPASAPAPTPAPVQAPIQPPIQPTVPPAQ